MSDYENFPPLTEILQGGGRPGVEYIYVLGKNIGKAQKDGFSMLASVPAFEVDGRSVVCMGRGDPVKQGRSSAWRAKLYIDKEAKRAKPGPKPKSPQADEQGSESVSTTA